MSADKIDDGGAAFPVFVVCGSDAESFESIARQIGELTAHGVSLRDWFAAHASGFDGETSPRFAQESLGIEPAPPSTDPKACGEWWARADALHRYRQADAMLAARAKEV